ncbi:MAG: hypothetical protein NT090_13910, partial [Acidobacteria bacterium]|nr:hypothetical protein [Acidobacteriota bacterium]
MLTATSGERARRVPAEEHVDAVVSGERMPHLTGSALLGFVRRNVPAPSGLFSPARPVPARRLAQSAKGGFTAASGSRPIQPAWLARSNAG